MSSVRARLADRTVVLCVTSAALFATMFGRLVVSPVAGRITATFGVSTAAFGAVMTGMWAAYALSQYPSGLLAARFGERRVVLVAVVLTACGAVGLALAPTFAAFAVLVALLGVGTGLQYPAGTTLLTDLFDGTGRAIGIHATAGLSAGLVAPGAAAWIATRYGWRPAVATGAGVALLALGVFAWGVRPTPPARPETALREQLDGTVVPLLRRPAVAVTTLIAVLADFVWQAAYSLLPLFLTEYHALGVGAAGALFSGYFLVQTTAQPLTGWVSDVAGRDATTAVLAVAGVAGFVTLVVAETAPVIAVGVGAVALSMTWSAPVQARFMDNLTDAERSAGFGLVRTLYTLVGSLGSVVTGVVAARAGWGSALAVLAAALVGVVFLLIGARVVGDRTPSATPRPE